MLVAAAAVSCFLYGKIKMIPLYIGPEKFTVEVADTYEKQLRGLMYRKTIPDDFGMLFIYGDEDKRGFWMKNCFVHLDLIFMNSDKQVVDIIHNVPPCENEPCETYISEKPAMYVLELGGGRAKELNLELGASIFFVLK